MEGFMLPKDHVQTDCNCGLTGIAVVAGVTLKEATDAYRAVQTRRPLKGNWKGTTIWPETLDTLKYLNVKFDWASPGCPMTLKTFARYHAKSDQRYLVRTTRHIQTLLNGLIIDQGGTTLAERSWQGRKRIQTVLEIY